MISINERTAVGSIGVVETGSFVCHVSTLPGFFRGTIAIFKAKPDGSASYPPVGKAYLARGVTKDQRHELHDWVMFHLNEIGEADRPLAVAIEGVFRSAKTRGMITKYITNPGC